MEIYRHICYSKVNSIYRGEAMEIGQRLKEARLAAGLSQRQLCGEVITRNMLSQIENGSARPSMDTLQYLAGELGKPVGYFLEEETASQNQKLMEKARAAFKQKDYVAVLELLQEYAVPDPVFDDEQYILAALTRLELAEAAINEGKAAYAERLLEQACEAGSKTPYYHAEARRLCLLYRARPDRAKELAERLPADPDRTLLLAAADPDRAEQILEADPQDRPGWHELRGDVYFRQGRYSKARNHYEKAAPSRQMLQKLEQCCQKQEDYKAAYEYACRLRTEYP